MFHKQAGWQSISLLLVCIGVLLLLASSRIAASTPAQEPVSTSAEQNAPYTVGNAAGVSIAGAHVAEGGVSPDANPCADDRWHSLDKQRLVFYPEDISQPQLINISRTTNRQLPYTGNSIRNKDAIPDWLTIRLPAKGISSEIGVEINPSGLAEGVHYATPVIWIEYDENSEETFCGPDTEGDGHWYKIADILQFEVELSIGPCSPTIRNVHSSPNENQMWDKYHVRGAVRLPSTCHGPQQITVTAGEVSWRSFPESDAALGDQLRSALKTLDGGTQLTLTLKPGETQTVTFASMHHYDWLAGYPKYSACFFGGRLQLSKLHLPWTKSKIYEHIDAVAKAHNPGELVTRRWYGFFIQAKVKDGPTSRRTVDDMDPNAPLVRPDLVSIIATNYSVQKSRVAMLFTLADIQKAQISTWYAGLGMVGAMEYIHSCSRPAIVATSGGSADSLPFGGELPPSISDAPASAAKEYAIALFTANKWFREAVDLAGQAHEAGEGNNKTLLEQAAEAQSRYDEAAAGLPSLRAAYLAEIGADDLEIDDNTWMTLYSELETNGLPAAQKQILTEAGFTEEQIEQLTDALIEQVDLFGTTWQDDLDVLTDWQSTLGTLNEEYIEEMQQGGANWWVYLPNVRK